ncbi:MAG: hypothetical protein WDW38_008892 [Sanguina aurantia]
MFREGGRTTAVVSQGRRKVSTTWDDGSELMEEYDAKTAELMVRKRRVKTTLGGEGAWEFMIGEPPVRWNPEQGTMQESSQNPIFSRKDARDCFQWRVRNLPYPSDTYNISVDTKERKVVVRTSNKKYFKKFEIPELDSLRLPLEEASLSWHHANNTLILSYAKPVQVIAAERMEYEETRKLRVKEEGDMDCKQQ